MVTSVPNTNNESGRTHLDELQVSLPVYHCQ